MSNDLFTGFYANHKPGENEPEGPSGQEDEAQPQQQEVAAGEAEVPQVVVPIQDPVADPSRTLPQPVLGSHLSMSDEKPAEVAVLQEPHIEVPLPKPVETSNDVEMEPNLVPENEPAATDLRDPNEEQKEEEKEDPEAEVIPDPVVVEEEADSSDKSEPV